MNMNILSLNGRILTLNGRITTTAKGLMWTAGASVLTLIGLAGLVNYLIQGHEAYNIYRQVPWGIHVAAYEFFVSVSAGLAIIGSAGVAFRLRGMERMAKRVLTASLATLIAGFFVLFTEIGHPLRMLIYTIVSPNPQAALFWMGVLYGAYILLVSILLFLLHLGKVERARSLAISTLVIAVLALGNVGTVFGYLVARPLWHGAFLPPYIVLTALIAGLGIYFLLNFLRYPSDERPEAVRSASERAGLFCAALLVVLAFFELSKILVGLYGQSPGKYEAVQILLTGPLAINFWLFEIFVGIIAPAALLLYSKAKSLLTNTLAGIGAVVGMFFMRYDMVVAGQLVPLRADVDAVGLNGLLSYTPSPTEIAIVLGGFGLCLLMYIAANLIFNLDADEH